MHWESTASGGQVETAPAFELARRLHDTVAQRLAGLSYLLAAESLPLDPTLARCRSEVDAALGELRAALVGVDLGKVAGRAAVDAEVQALLGAFPRLQLRWMPDLELEIEHGGLIENFLVEGLRNVRKHADPSGVDVTVARQPGVTVVEIVNDGVGQPKAASSGVGRRLLELEASFQGALVESAATGQNGWSQRIVLPR